MRRRILEPESQGSLSGITGISVKIPTDDDATYTLSVGDKDNTVFRELTYSDFPFRFEPIPPNYFTSPYLSISSRYSYIDPSNLNGQYIDIYYYCKDSSIFTGWELVDLTINGNTIGNEDDPNFPSIYTLNDDGVYRFSIVIPSGFYNDYTGSHDNIMDFYMYFDLHIEDDILHGDRIYISL